MMGINTRKCKITQEAPNRFRVILVQGLNRQIRRMCEYFGYEVTKLERIRIMNIGLKGLPLGDWRELSENEMDTIYQMIENSTSDHLKNPKKTAAKKPVNANKDLRTSAPKSAQGPRKPKAEGSKKSASSTRKPASVSGKSGAGRPSNPKASGRRNKR